MDAMNTIKGLPPRWARAGRAAMAATMAGLVLGLVLARPHVAAAQGRQTPSYQGAQSIPPNPEYSALFSLLYPGVGQIYNGDPLTGIAHMGSYTALVSNYFRGTEHPDYILPQNRYDGVNNIIHTNRQTFETDFYGQTAFNVNLYSIYAAYRDARQHPGNLRGYSTPPPQESLGDVFIAPFRPSLLARPTTFLPLLLPLYIATQKPTREDLVIVPDNTITRTELRRGYFLEHWGVAIGEEAFFRGYVNNGLSDWWGEGWGLAGSSVLFGLAHSGNPGQATGGGAFLYGLYLGWLHQRNDYDMSQGIAIHFWWNFLVSVAFTNEREKVVAIPLYITF